MVSCRRDIDRPARPTRLAPSQLVAEAVYSVRTCNSYMVLLFCYCTSQIRSSSFRLLEVAEVTQQRNVLVQHTGSQTGFRELV